MLASGPIGLIAALELLCIIACGYAIWHFIKQRTGQTSLVKSNADKVERLQAAHNSKIGEIHDSYQAQLATLNEKRIQDIKETSEDYSALTTQVQETINRLVLQLELRGRK